MKMAMPFPPAVNTNYTLKSSLKYTLYDLLVGRYCEWEHRTVDRSSEIATFEEYKETLVYNCEDGEPGYMNWTVPLKAPDVLYYQVSEVLSLTEISF